MGQGISDMVQGGLGTRGQGKILQSLPPLGETTEKGLYVDPSATFSQAYHPSSRGPFEKRAPMRSPVAGDGHGTPSPAPASLALQ